MMYAAILLIKKIKDEILVVFDFSALYNKCVTILEGNDDCRGDSYCQIDYSISILKPTPSIDSSSNPELRLSLIRNRSLLLAPERRTKSIQ